LRYIFPLLLLFLVGCIDRPPDNKLGKVTNQATEIEAVVVDGRAFYIEEGFHGDGPRCWCVRVYTSKGTSEWWPISTLSYED
jgi:hypothetical protein